MADIVVTKINEVFLKVICDKDHITQEIEDFFTFWSPGFQWSPAYKQKKWDGKIRLYSKYVCKLYTGLTRHLIEFANSRKYTIEFQEKIGLMNNFSLEEAAEYIKTLNVHAHGSPIEPREYQIVGVAKAIRYRRMLMLSPTNSGKSYMMYCISRWLLDHDCKKGLIIVPTISLVEQLKTDFEDYANGVWDVDENIHKVWAGEVKKTDKPITISTWQSIYEKKRKGFFEEFDFVIGDEAHGFKADCLKSIMTKLINARYRIAMTGTLDNWKVHRLIIEGLFGPNSKLTTTKQMIDNKQSADLHIKALILKHPMSMCRMVAGFTAKTAYQKEMKYLIGSVPRNRFLTNLVCSLNGNSLMLFQYVDMHGKILHKMVEDKVAKGRKVFYIHGKTEVEDREAVRSIVENETDAIIIASYGVFSTGINIRNLHNIIFASPSKSKVRVLQSIGRGLRVSDSKTSMTLYDVADDLRIEDFINFTLRHFAERVKIYKAEEFRISNYPIELK